ncbi:hypothetical protein ABL78_2280 [Leptomonas seymouri]|uniref:Uncharacterized protein n=1 Tax=Leptomonas seymouri TaxID=5684 RepID=A0A0N1PFF4_LEPSE|nr:hypothetical protein ABL78_2280 [Leptomonas seymouri]|eukprot:KPI88612.1 hypothetical protein ABL78_2280 [Leptomonas seymouri]
MDAWFAYVLRLCELIFDKKLEVYEDACATHVLSAVGVHATAPTSDNSGAVPGATVKSPSADAAATKSVPLSSSNAAHSTPTPNTAVQRKTESVSEGSSFNGTHHGLTSSSSMTTPISAGGQSCDDSAESKVAATAGAPAAGLPSPPPVTSPVAIVSALLDAVQLRKPLRTVPSRSLMLDDVQAEAEVAYQDLEEVYLLRPGDVSAVRGSAGDAQLTLPLPLEACPNRASSSNRLQECPFPSCSHAGDEGVTASSAPLEHQLLYGELTPIGVRQLQAISIASVSVSREALSYSQSMGLIHGETPLNNLVSATNDGGGDTYDYNDGGAHTGSLRNTTGGMSLLTAGNVPRGAVVVCVDVGCGNGRLLFEWARLAAAACRRRPESSRRPSHTHDSGAPPPVPHSTHNGCTGGDTYAAAARRSKLLAAAMGPLDVQATNIVLRGWMGVGIEMVPSRMRVARRALVPHYLDLKPALLVPAGAVDQYGGREVPVPLLDPVAPEAIAVPATSDSFSSPSSLGSATILRTTPTSTMCSSTPAAPPKPLATRVPQPTARVLLYEGDALTPGVLSNATLCRFPHFSISGGALTLLRGCGSMPMPSKAYDLVNGLGGQHIGSFGNARRYSSSMSAPGAGGGAACPYSIVNVSGAGAALNNAYLNSAAAGAYSRAGGPASFMEVSACSVTSNASSTCSNRGGSSAKHNYYRLCRVEKGPSLTGREDPHLMVFCCGLGFDESQAWKLCQRLEDMLLSRAAQAFSPTQPVSVGGCSSSRNMSEDEAGMQPFSTVNQTESTEAAVSSQVGKAISVTSDDNGEVLEEMARGFGQQVTTPTVAEPAQGGASGNLTRDMSNYRHWESMTCVLLLRPMDVLAPNFPLFRYATRIYNTHENPIAAEDTAMLLATGNRTDNTAVEYVMRDLPISDSPQDANMASTILESDVWTTTLATTWMNAAPAWVVRFRF